jgi:hypothetical protein
MFDQDLQAEVVKVTESKGTVDDASDGAIDAFHKALGDAVIEVVEELMPPRLRPVAPQPFFAVRAATEPALSEAEGSSW